VVTDNDGPERAQDRANSPIPQNITCVDCGGLCHCLIRIDVLTPGMVVPYRCEDCLDRWDLVFEAEDLEEGGY